MSTRTSATRERLRNAALDLFEARGYRTVTVEDIAAAAGVSHMTFFRHFATKERVLLDDPFDPVIAEAVAAQPADLPAIERVARGILSLSALLESGLTDADLRGIAIAAGVPELGPALAANTAATEQAIVERAGDPSFPEPMRIAASAMLAGLTAALLAWAGRDDGRSMTDVVTDAVLTVAPGLSGVDVPPARIEIAADTVRP